MFLQGSDTTQVLLCTFPSCVQLAKPPADPLFASAASSPQVPLQGTCACRPGCIARFVLAGLPKSAAATPRLAWSECSCRSSNNLTWAAACRSYCLSFGIAL